MPALLLLAVLLAAGLAFNLAHLDTGGDAAPAIPNAGGTTPARTGVLDVQAYQSVFVVAFFLLAAATVVLFLRSRRRARVAGRPRSLTFWDVLGAILGLGIFLVFLYVWPHAVGALQNNPGDPGPTSNGTASASPLPTVAGLPLGLFFAGAFVLALVLIVRLLHLGDFVPRPLPSGLSRASREVAAEAVADTIREIEIGGDVRGAILACFDRFCRLLGERGVREQISLTPRELEALAVRGLRVSEESADSLTTLFEEARYSEHALDDADRDRAVESLRRIRAALEA